MEEEIKKVLDEVRPHLQMDGGDVEFISFDAKNGALKVRLQGACSHCAMATVTLKEGIGRIVMARIPEVKEIISA